MFGQFSEQMTKSSQPVSKLLAANVKAMEAVTKQQTQFFSGLVDDSVKLMQSVAQQTEMKGILAAQSVYAESIRERLTSSSKVTYDTISSVSKEFNSALQPSIETATDTAKQAAVSASSLANAIKTPSAAKVVKVAAKKKTKVKTAQASTDTAAKTAAAAAKVAAKPVATLSADEVKAPAKIKTADVKTTVDNQSAGVTKA